MVKGTEQRPTGPSRVWSIKSEGKLKEVIVVGQNCV